MDSNQSRTVGGTILRPHQGSLTNLGASGRLQSQIQAILGQILTFPDLPCPFSQICMVSNGLYRSPNIVLHISCSTRTCWEHLRSSKVSFSSIAERSSLLLRQYEFWIYCFLVIFFKCFAWNVSFASILAAPTEAKKYGVITYWLISSRIANC